MIDDLHGIYHGTVLDNTDPEILGRVRVRIPGLIETGTAWAWPHGTLGGGSAGRGFYAVPEVGADVTVQFILGDPDFPIYQSGFWGKAGGNTEVPSYLAGMSAAAATQVRVLETKNFLLVFDDRSGSEALLIKDKNNATGLIKISGGNIELGGTGLSATVNGVVLGSCVDPFSGATHAQLAGGASTMVMAKK